MVSGIYRKNQLQHYVNAALLGINRADKNQNLYTELQNICQWFKPWCKVIERETWHPQKE